MASKKIKKHAVQVIRKEPTLEEIIQFLCGSRPLKGRWFGDDPPIENGLTRPYWWRSELRAAYEREIAGQRRGGPGEP